MQTSSNAQPQLEPKNDRPERGRLWLIVAIVLTLHAALLGSVVLMQGCSKSQPINTTDASSSAQETPALSETVQSDASSPMSLPTPLPGADLLTPEEHLAGPEIAQTPTAETLPAPAPAVENQPKVESIPSSQESAAIAPVKAAAPAKYAVQKNDTLAKIARKYAISVGELASANKLNIKAPLKVGQKLLIPSSKSVETARMEKKSPVSNKAAVIASNEASGKTHQVKSGETPTSIARHYKVSVQALLRANHISDPKKVRVNQKLLIPVTATVRERPGTTSASSPGVERPSEIRPASLQVDSRDGNGVSGI